jgi:hypothetical protein
MYYSELVKDERLIFPLAPERVCRLEKTYVSIKIYEPESLAAQQADQNLAASSSSSSSSALPPLPTSLSNSEDILYIKKLNERFIVFHEIGDGEWLWAQSYDTNECGLLLAECVKCVVSQDFC